MAVVEFAPNQKVGYKKEGRRKDAKINTLDEEPEFRNKVYCNLSRRQRFRELYDGLNYQSSRFARHIYSPKFWRQRHSAENLSILKTVIRTQNI